MYEPILDNIKETAMKVDFLRDLLRSDSIYIGSAMTFDNLELLSKFVGKLGDESRGGLALEEFRRRQKLHQDAEVQTMLDVGEFIRKAHVIYGYEHFVNDSSGSICELNDNRVLEHLYEHTLIVYLSTKEELEKEIIHRQERHPKPLFYAPEFLHLRLKEYLEQYGLDSSEQIDPEGFVRWIFPHLMRSRRPKYEAIASQYGYTLPAEKIDDVRDEQDFIEFVCSVLDSND